MRTNIIQLSSVGFCVIQNNVNLIFLSISLRTHILYFNSCIWRPATAVGCACSEPWFVLYREEIRIESLICVELSRVSHLPSFYKERRGYDVSSTAHY